MSDQPQLVDHQGRSYILEGGIGTIVGGSRARVWIWAFSKRRERLCSRSIRLDLHTARLFHAELGRAIAAAELGEARWNAEFPQYSAASLPEVAQ